MTLTRTGFIPIPPGRQPGFDHADIFRDGAATARLYVAHTGADRVDVIDCPAGSWLRALDGHPGVAGILVDVAADLLFTSDRAASQVSFYRCSDESLQGRVKVGPHPNGLAFDPGRGRLFCFNLGEPVGENCTVSVIDVAGQYVIATVPLHDPALGHLYVAIADPGVITVADTTSLEIIQTMPTERGAHTLGIDPQRRAVYAFLPDSGGAAVYEDR